MIVGVSCSSLRAQYPWLIPALPLLACVLIGAFGKWLKGLAHVPAILAMVGSCALALATPVWALATTADCKLINVRSSTGSPSAVSASRFASTIDHLTALYLSFITGIGLLIFIYAAGLHEGGLRLLAVLRLHVDLRVLHVPRW